MSNGAILFVMYDGGGSVAFNTALIRRLAARGNNVHVVGEPSVERRATEAGAIFHCFEFSPSFQLGSGGPAHFSESGAGGDDSLEKFHQLLMCGPALAYARDTLRVATQVDARLVVADYVLLGALIGAEAAGVPIAVLRPILTPRGDSSPEQWAPHVAVLNSARAELGLKPIRSHHDLYDRAERLLVQTTKEFNPELDYVPANVRFVGPPFNEDLPPVVDHHGRPPTAVVSLGMTDQGQSRIVDDVVAGAAAAVPCVVVLTGNAVDASRHSWGDEVEVRVYAPHLATFAEADVVICHAGPGTVMAALAVGVPCVCVPLGLNQIAAADRVKALGLGRVLDADPTPTMVENAVLDVLGERPPGLDAMRDAIARDVASDRATAEIEALARHARSPMAGQS